VAIPLFTTKNCDGQNGCVLTLIMQTKICPFHSEQTYCQKWLLDKMPKTVLGHNDEKIFKKY